MSQLTDNQKRKAAELMSSMIPHTVSLGVTVESVADGALTLRLPYQDCLVGDPETGALHGGVLSVLLDQAMGLSCIVSDEAAPSVTPTLDLRIDHLGVAPPGRDLFACGRVYRATRRIVFVEGSAWCESPDKPIARAMGSWVLVAPVNLATFLDNAPGGTGE